MYSCTIVWFKTVNRTKADLIKWFLQLLSFFYLRIKCINLDQLLPALRKVAEITTSTRGKMSQNVYLLLPPPSPVYILCLLFCVPQVIKNVCSFQPRLCKQILNILQASSLCSTKKAQYIIHITRFIKIHFSLLFPVTTARRGGMLVDTFHSEGRMFHQFSVEMKVVQGRFLPLEMYHPTNLTGPRLYPYL